MGLIGEEWGGVIPSLLGRCALARGWVPSSPRWQLFSYCSCILLSALGTDQALVVPGAVQAQHKGELTVQAGKQGLDADWWGEGV